MKRMAWAVDKKSMAVTMHKGNTGAYWVQLERTSGKPFEQGDVAIYEVRQGQTVVIHKEFDLQPETPTDEMPGNGRFLISFRNSDTDTLATGSYSTEILVSLNPIRSDGEVVDGDNVKTLIRSTITINDVLINI